MFATCHKLETAPELPATTLESECYHRMFYDCKKINSVKVKFTEWTENTTVEWLHNAPSSGTFTAPSNLPQIYG
jgi:hypothetical protein